VSLAILDDIASSQEQQIESKNLKELQKTKHLEAQSKKADKRKQKKHELRANSLAEAAKKFQNVKKQKLELEGPPIPLQKKSGKQKKRVSFKPG